jgi:hypothetical protein
VIIALKRVVNITRGSAPHDWPVLTTRRSLGRAINTRSRLLIAANPLGGRRV